MKMGIAVLFQNELVTKMATRVHIKQTASAAEGTSNTMSILVDDLNAISVIEGASLRSASGAFNTAGLTVNFSGGTINVAATDIVAGDVFTCSVLGIV
jgi:hypothetical protein